MIESTQTVNDKDSTTMTAILCEGSLDISSAAKLHETLIDAIEAGHPVNINLDDTTRIDTSCTQLLFSFYNEAKDKHIEVETSTDNNFFMDTLALTGLSDLLDIS